MPKALSTAVMKSLDTFQMHFLLVNLWCIYNQLRRDSILYICLLFNGVLFWTTIVFPALRSGGEHGQLRHNPCQIELYEPRNERSFQRRHIEESSWKNERIQVQTKSIVVHYSNPENPQRCCCLRDTIVCVLARAIRSISLLANTQQNCWFSRAPLGHHRATRKHFKHASYTVKSLVMDLVPVARSQFRVLSLESWVLFVIFVSSTILSYLLPPLPSMFQ